jgi:membrane protein YqaA with SNARE-associated domain
VYRALTWIQGVLIPGLGPLGLFLVAFLDSSFVSLPEINDILVISAALRSPASVGLAVTLATLGSVAGCAVLWLVGRRGGQALLERRYGPERTARTRAAYRRFGILALAVPAVLPPPMPFKVFVLAAGVFGFPFRRFVVTLLVARGVRYAFWGSMGIVYGEAGLVILQAVDGWTTARMPLLGLLAALGGLLVAWTLFRRRRARLGVGGVS